MKKQILYGLLTSILSHYTTCICQHVYMYTVYTQHMHYQIMIEIPWHGGLAGGFGWCVILYILNPYGVYTIIKLDISIPWSWAEHGSAGRLDNVLFDSSSTTFTKKYLLHINKGSTNQFNKSFSNISARVWNALQKAIDVNIYMHPNSNICLKRTFLNIHLMYFTQNEIAILLCSYVADHIYICKMFIY